MLEKLMNRWNTAVILDREERSTFYGVLRSQIHAGIPVRTACESIQALEHLPATWHRLARAGYQSGHQGRTIAAAWRDTNLLPDEDIGVIRVAERTGTLPQAFRSLEQKAGRRTLSFASRVVVPNAYYLSILLMLLVVVWHVQPFAATLSMDLTTNSAWVLSGHVRAHGPWVGAMTLALILTTWHGKNRWTRPGWRRLLLGFDLEFRYRVSLEFARLAEMLGRQGASNVEILESFLEVRGDNPFVRAAVRDAGRRVHQSGERWENAISGGLLTAEHASLLASLVPGEQRDLYPDAYQALAGIIERMLTMMYRRIGNIFRMLVFGGIAALFLLLYHGLFSISKTVSQLQSF